DINPIMINRCIKLGLPATKAEAINYLKNLKNNSLGGVTAFHIIEHVHWKQMIKLFAEILRVLQPNGIAILETPNPENIIVGSCNFYCDPSHEKPLFPETVKFLLEQCGFVNVELMKPIQRVFGLATSSDPLTEFIKERFTASPNFGLIAWKPCYA